MRLAIIGAGVAGLAAARALRQRRPELAITVYEKSRGLGGRAATRRREGFAFDHGAQYVKTPTPELERLLTSELPSGDLLDIGRPVWTFDGAGAIAAGDPAQNADPKWTYRDGLNRLGKLLAEGLTVRREVRIGRIRPKTKDQRPKASADAALSSVPSAPLRAGVGRRSSVSYELFDADGAPVGEADLILLTPPAPQAAEIVAACELEKTVRDFLLSNLEGARYRRCISVALAYDRRIERPFYALVNNDRAHPIAWLALEHDKGPGRCPPGHGLLIAQMAPQFSVDHWETRAEDLSPIVAGHVGALIGQELLNPLWADVQRWRYALPDSGADFAALNGTGSGLFFAGDYTAGQGRVHLAIESGWRAAAEIDRAISLQ